MSEIERQIQAQAAAISQQEVLHNAHKTPAFQVPEEHRHYFFDFTDYGLVDVYRLIEILDIKCPAAQHILKKAIATGKRGHKDLRHDWEDMRDTAQRKMNMLDEDATIVWRKQQGMSQTGEAFPDVAFDGEKRMAPIGQNGNDGGHYDEPPPAPMPPVPMPLIPRPQNGDLS